MSRLGFCFISYCFDKAKAQSEPKDGGAEPHWTWTWSVLNFRLKSVRVYTKENKNEFTSQKEKCPKEKERRQQSNTIVQL